MSTPKTPPTSVPAVKTSTGYQEKLQDPLKGQGGRINSPFGPRVAPKPGASTFHKGTDIKAPEGTPVYAAASGIVEFAGVKSGYGNYIKIRHDNKTETAYAHLSIIYVRANQRVTQGEIIGKVGHTGNVTGNHLHYEVIENGTQINPNGTGSVAINANDRSAAEKGAKDRAEGNGTKEPISPEYKEAIFTQIGRAHV